MMKKKVGALVASVAFVIGSAGSSSCDDDLSVRRRYLGIRKR